MEHHSGVERRINICYRLTVTNQTALALIFRGLDGLVAQYVSAKASLNIELSLQHSIYDKK